MLTASRLKEIFSASDFRPLKRLGENFLVDFNIKDKIIKEALLSPGDVVVEIGPGLGALTFDLAGKCKKIIAVEKDRKACAILKSLAGDGFRNLNIAHADILKFDLDDAAVSGKVKIVGNLPYYITTPIIEYLIENKKRIKSALIVIQKEVASRLMAGPGSKDYGSISCFVQYHARPAYIHTIKRTAFYPQPEVDSSLLRLDFPETPSVKVEDEELFFKVIRGSFNQRRKSVINSLSRPAVLNMEKDTLAQVLRRIGIDPAARPETLSLTAFASIANAISSSNHS